MMKENLSLFLTNPFVRAQATSLSTSNYVLTPFHARSLGFFWNVTRHCFLFYHLWILHYVTYKFVPAISLIITVQSFEMVVAVKWKQK